MHLTACNSGPRPFCSHWSTSIPCVIVCICLWSTFCPQLISPLMFSPFKRPTFHQRHNSIGQNKTKMLIIASNQSIFKTLYFLLDIKTFSIAAVYDISNFPSLFQFSKFWSNSSPTYIDIVLNYESYFEADIIFNFQYSLPFCDPFIICALKCQKKKKNLMPWCHNLFIFHYHKYLSTQIYF